MNGSSPTPDQVRWAVRAHVTTVLALPVASAPIGVVVAAAIWLRNRDSPFVAAHAAQAALYQLALIAINLGLAGLWVLLLFGVFMGESTIGEGALSMRQILTGLWLALIPMFGIWHIATVALAIVQAARVSRGREAWYPIIGDSIRRRYGVPRQPSRSARGLSLR